VNDETRAASAGTYRSAATYPDCSAEFPQARWEPGPFVLLPTSALSDPNLRRSDLRTLGALCAFRNAQTGRCFPSHRRLGEVAGLPINTVRTALKRLRRFGHVDWTNQYRPGTTAYKTNEYRVIYVRLPGGVVLPAPQGVVPLAPQVGSPGDYTCGPPSNEEQNLEQTYLTEALNRLTAGTHSRAEIDEDSETEPNPAAKKSGTKPKTSSLHDPDADVAKRNTLEAIDAQIAGEAHAS
jgi:hypothetical protein